MELIEERIAIRTAAMDKLPTSELGETLSEFASPFTAMLPDERLRQVVP